MKNVLLMSVLCTVLIGTGGCFISVKDTCPPERHVSPEQPVIDSTIAEIEAVKTLSTSAARLNVLKAIAARPGLSPEARIHLVEATQSLSTSAAREELLMVLAQNPPMRSEPMPQPRLHNEPPME